MSNLEFNQPLTTIWPLARFRRYYQLAGVVCGEMQAQATSVAEIYSVRVIRRAACQDRRYITKARYLAEGLTPVLFKLWGEYGPSAAGPAAILTTHQQQSEHGSDIVNQSAKSDGDRRDSSGGSHQEAQAYARFLAAYEEVSREWHSQYDLDNPDCLGWLPSQIAGVLGIWRSYYRPENDQYEVAFYKEESRQAELERMIKTYEEVASHYRERHRWFTLTVDQWEAGCKRFLLEEVEDTESGLLGVYRLLRGMRLRIRHLRHLLRQQDPARYAVNMDDNQLWLPQVAAPLPPISPLVL